MNIAETVRQIKQDLRAVMNGPISSSMRQKGLGYKIIFGVEWPRLQELAKGYEKDALLSNALWKEDIRECKLIAMLIYPKEQFASDLAEAWIENIRYAEEAQYLTLTLLQDLPDAQEVALNWIARGDEQFSRCGFLLLARQFMKGNDMYPRDANEYIDQTISVLSDSNHPLRQEAYSALSKFAMLGEIEQKMAQSALNTANNN